jgi:hypothetical protein
MNKYFSIENIETETPSLLVAKVTTTENNDANDNDDDCVDE